MDIIVFRTIFPISIEILTMWLDLSILWHIFFIFLLTWIKGMLKWGKLNNRILLWPKDDKSNLEISNKHIMARPPRKTSASLSVLIVFWPTETMLRAGPFFVIGANNGNSNLSSCRNWNIASRWHNNFICRKSCLVALLDSSLKNDNRKRWLFCNYARSESEEYFLSF